MCLKYPWLCCFTDFLKITYTILFFSLWTIFIWEWGIFFCLIPSPFLLSDPAKPLFAPDVCKHFPTLHVLIFIVNSFNELNLSPVKLRPVLSLVPHGAGIIPAWFRLQRHLTCLSLPTRAHLSQVRRGKPHCLQSSPAWTKSKKRWSFGELIFKLINY